MKSAPIATPLRRRHTIFLMLVNLFFGKVKLHFLFDKNYSKKEPSQSLNPDRFRCIFFDKVV